LSQTFFSHCLAGFFDMISFARLTLAGALAAGATSALAADLPSRHTPPPPVFLSPANTINWSGFYAGVWGGYYAGKVEQTCVGVCPVDPRLDGYMVGVNAGYDWQFANNLVVGAMFTAPLNRISDSYLLAPGVLYRAQPQYAGTAAVRFGFAAHDLLPYVFAGVTASQMRISTAGQKIDNVHVGAVIGAGLEYAITGNWSADFRYSYMIAPKKVYDFGAPDKYGAVGQFIQIGINYRFGGSSPTPGPLFARY
jgi:opacity protein-like surface antigen